MARLPDDPAAFVAAAERGINEYDLDATVAAYADGAHVAMVADGAREDAQGARAVRAMWAGYLEAMRAHGYTLRKTLVSAADGVIVNTWESDFRGRTRGLGIETWRFDTDGRVADHAMYAYLEVRPSTDPLQRLRLLFGHPRISLAFLRSGIRARRAS